MIRRKIISPCICSVFQSIRAITGKLFLFKAVQPSGLRPKYFLLAYWACLVKKQLFIKINVQNKVWTNNKLSSDKDSGDKIWNIEMYIWKKKVLSKTHEMRKRETICIIIMMITAAAATTMCLLQSPHSIPWGFPMEPPSSVHHQFLGFSTIIKIDSILLINDANSQTCLNPYCRSPTYLNIFITPCKFFSSKSQQFN